MGAKLCTSKANRKFKENQGKKYKGNKKKRSKYNPTQNTLKKPHPHLHSGYSDNDNKGYYRSASVHKKINNGSNIKLTPYSSIDSVTDGPQIPLYEQLNDSIINRDGNDIRLRLDINVNQNANDGNTNNNNGNDLGSDFVMLAEPSNDHLSNPAFLSFGKSNGSLCSSSFYLSPTNKNIMFSDNKQDDDDQDEDDVIIDEDEVYVPPQHKMTIGDEVELSIEYNSLHGVIRFIGELLGRDGIWYGLQLNRPKGSDDVTYWKNQSNIHNKLIHVKSGNDDSINNNDHIELMQTASNRGKGHKCDGCYAGYCYFKCDSNEGLFVRETQIAKVLIVNYNNPRIAINEEIYIKKYDGKGIVKYIGKPEYENDENIHETYYGIKLLSQCNDANANDTNNGIFHNRRYFSNCPVGYGVFVMSSDLSQYVIPSRYNLLCHGYFQCKTNIPPVIIKLIDIYSNIIDIRLTHIPSPDPTIMGNRILLQSQMISHRKYQLFDINNNMFGPSITVTKCGSNTQRKECQVSISGHYQFIKSKFLDLGDRNIEFVRRTEYEIMKFNNGGSDTETIFRSIETDNDIPLFKDYKTNRQRFNPYNNIHQNDKNLDMDQNKLIQEISDLYKVTPKEILKQFKRYNIELYGLNDISINE